jgi:hypothetical protein
MDWANMFSTKAILGSAISACLLAPIITVAGSFDTADLKLSFNPPIVIQADPTADSSGQTTSDAPVATTPQYLDVAPEGPQIHGFFDSPFKTAYITPRGLVVQDKGLAWQPVVGLVLPLPDIGLKNASVVAGIWNSVTTAQGDPKVGAWNEMDVFVGFGGSITKELRVDFDYEAWNFPNSTLNKPSTEHVMQLKLSYDDSAFWGKSGFALHPYINAFYEVGGSSTVVLGKNGQTGYIEPGIVPTYTIKGSTPITLTFPTYISIGPKEFWGSGVDALHKADGNFGVFSTGINVDIPLTFIPVKYGNWHAEAGVLYYHLINNALLRSGNLLSGNTDRDKFNTYVGVGVGF